MAATSFAEDHARSTAEYSAHPLPPTGELPERVRRLEEEVAELRGTVTRFADVMVGEVKDIREKQAIYPAVPPELAAAMPMAVAGLATTNGAVPYVSPSARRPWLLSELIGDLRTTIQMYLDPRYRVRRSTQLMVPMILGLLVLNCIFFNWAFTLALVSTALEKIIDILLAVMLYKVLHREMERYREALAQYAVWKAYQASTSHLVTMTTDPAHPPTTRQETE